MINILMGVLLLLIVLVIGFVIAVAVTSGDKVSPFVDEQGNVLPNSIAEKTFVSINGRENGMFIKKTREIRCCSLSPAGPAYRSTG